MYRDTVADTSSRTIKTNYQSIKEKKKTKIRILSRKQIHPYPIASSLEIKI